MKNLLLVIFSIASFDTFSQQANGLKCDTIILNALEGGDKDATISNYLSPNSNNGNDPNMIAETWTAGGGEFTSRAAFNFPLPILPPQAVISSADLYYYYNPTTTHLQGNSYYPGSPYNSPNDGTIYRITQNWNAGTVTWNNQPSYTLQNAVTVPPSTSKTQNLTVSVTQLVIDMYQNPGSSYGFLFKMNTEAIYRSQVYASSDNLDASLHPKLVICYTVPTPENVNMVDEQNITLQNIQNRLILFNPMGTLIQGVVIYDAVGHVIIRNTSNTNTSSLEFNLTHCPPGIYFVEVKTNKSRKVLKISVQ